MCCCLPKQGGCTLGSAEQFSKFVVASKRSYIAAAKAFHAFCKLDFAAIYQQYAAALNKSVDELTDNEKRQAIMDTVLSNAE
jgi:hypothetical protein